jgi:hypothetical protein
MRRKMPVTGRTTWGTNCRPNCVYLEGRKRKESWDDKQTGAKQYRDLAYVDRIEFLDSGGSGNGQRENARKRFRRDNSDTPRDGLLTQDCASCVHFFPRLHWDNVRLGLLSPTISKRQVSE